MRNIIFSIIVPHKNIPVLLQRCIESIPQRDDLEIIIIDDNSDKTIVDFNNFPGAEREDVIVVFDKSNKGPGFARNVGVNLAKGRWILFVDADDYFNYCLRDILDDYKEDKADVVYFAASSVDSDTYHNSSRADDFVHIINDYFKDKTLGELLLRYVVASPCGKLIKRSLLVNNNIMFPDVLICEDVEFSYMLGFYAKQIKADKRALCCYTSRTISRSSVLSEDLLLEKARVSAKRDKFLIDNQIRLPLGMGYVDILLELQKQNNNELKTKVFKILNEYDISHELVNMMLEAKEKAMKENIICKLRRRIAFRTRIKRLFRLI